MRSQKTRPDQIWVMEGMPSERVQNLLKKARENGIRVCEKDKREFQKFSHLRHQGIIALVREFRYLGLEEWARKTSMGKNPVVVALDHITDEGNLGGIIRSSFFLEADAIVLTKDRSAQITPTVVKRSSGACFHMDIILVTNLHMALTELKRLGFWVIGTSAKEGIEIYEFDLIRPIVLIMGSESKGTSPVLKRVMDATIRVPGNQTLDSLNVSAATAVILYEISRQKKTKGKN